MDILHFIVALVLGTLDIGWRILVLVLPLVLVGALAWRANRELDAVGALRVSIASLAVVLVADVGLWEMRAGMILGKSTLPHPMPGWTDTVDTVSVLQMSFWHEQYFDFWLKVVNPARIPIGEGVRWLTSLPHGDGAVAVAIALLPLVVALIVAGFKRVLAPMLTWILSMSLAMYYVSALVVWTWAIAMVTLFIWGIWGYMKAHKELGAIPVVRVIN